MNDHLLKYATDASRLRNEAQKSKVEAMLAKRLTDIFISVSALLGFAPLLAIIAVLIKLDSNGPVIFKQRRVGQDGEFFEIYKFRTMRIGTPDLPTDQMLKLESPITRVGSFLRKTSLDELPQLFNVLAGQMSLVGPRPALYNQVELTEKRKSEGVLRFPPGITGWAQVNGRDELPDDVKVKADKWYCEHWNYWLDWRIIFLTFGAVFSKKGAN
ncbi:MAG TPA: sugar transferase [Candidatus Obscuribacter sp.]|nr:sugar transferase [Candidatus Obscuribacter sp.]HMX46080.1 sugar transferase [Candidatus Obscuribacter sp.]HMY54928.1 sugar transferase [Candidatus Obscuribacter sp.]HNA72796.1 sugar transferase [Candidatus Obscuribacter sp.]HNB16014.1 sugar transferase [Candidatus Obscuribacter sp.]